MTAAASVSVEDARRAAGRMFIDRGYRQEAEIVLSGRGDDFAEVRIALALMEAQQRRQRRLVEALASYADTDFWDGLDEGTAPAADDRGAMARAALAALEDR